MFFLYLDPFKRQKESLYLHRQRDLKKVIGLTQIRIKNINPILTNQVYKMLIKSLFLSE